ncbi:MAG TPA: hypothetical protein VN428_12515, partial [Bryobacteraceae bacterium]|nr:hypothetical protein [Bryobacteraceae bacterium]
FGGAIRPGERNVLFSSLDLTPYAFLDRPRRYSPIVSVFRANPKPGFGIEWRADYDPARARKWTNSGISGDGRFGMYYVSVAHNMVRRVRLNPASDGTERFLTPGGNEFSGLFGIGHDNRRGWNAAFRSTYNFREGVMLYSTAQVTYNTDCCGFSVQYRRLYRRIGLTPSNENQFYISFSFANIGSFGTLKKQDRLF